MRSAPFDSALADAGADAFVQAGPPGDPTVSYLAGARLPCRAAVVYGGRVAVVPGRPIPEHVSVRKGVTVLDPAPTPAERLPDLVAESVLAPRTIPHDAALYLEGEGVDVASTAAHEDARSRKTDRELASLRDAVAAAEHGLDAAAALLADGDADSEALTDDRGETVTGERVRRAANAAAAGEGATPETAVQPAGAVEPGMPLHVTVAATVAGHRAPVFRTFVPDTDGGWDRRATLGCEYGVEAAWEVVEPGETSAKRAGSEATAELASLGFPPPTTEVDVHGVGLERREAPAGGDALAEGAVVSVRATAEPDEANGGGDEAADGLGPVGVSDVAVVIDEGAERVGSFPRSVVPKADY